MTGIYLQWWISNQESRMVQDTKNENDIIFTSLPEKLHPRLTNIFEIFA